MGSTAVSYISMAARHNMPELMVCSLNVFMRSLRLHGDSLFALVDHVAGETVQSMLQQPLFEVSPELLEKARFFASDHPTGYRPGCAWKVISDVRTTASGVSVHWDGIDVEESGINKAALSYALVRLSLED